jgi:hypothetical protein
MLVHQRGEAAAVVASNVIVARMVEDTMFVIVVTN